MSGGARLALVMPVLALGMPAAAQLLAGVLGG